MQDAPNNDLLTMDQLLEAAAAACADIEVSDTRVAEEITERTVRYYVTLGLVRPPVRMGGRSLWTRDHVNDLVRVRRAQALGQSLKQIPRFRERTLGSPFAQMNLSRSARAFATPPAIPADRTGWAVPITGSIVLTGFTDDQPTDVEIDAVRAALARLIGN